MMSYWVYQHLGNLSPDEIRAEGMLERFIKLGDATDALTEWAEEAEKFTPVPGGYRFSFYRDLGPVRAGGDRQPQRAGARARFPADGRRRRVGVGGRAQADVECDHLVLATSVPVVMPGGMHDLERWNERVCDGAWGQTVRPARREGPPRARPRGLVGVPRLVHRA